MLCVCMCVCVCGVLLQAFSYVSFGAVGDYSANRKFYFVLTGTLGAVFTICTVAVTPDLWWVGGVFMVLMQLGYGTSTLLYNSWLPLLVRAHEDVRFTELFLMYMYAHVCVYCLCLRNVCAYMRVYICTYTISIEERSPNQMHFTVFAVTPSHSCVLRPMPMLLESGEWLRVSIKCLPLLIHFRVNVFAREQGVSMHNM